jgi:hypothetical protein
MQEYQYLTVNRYNGITTLPHMEVRCMLIMIFGRVVFAPTAH